MKLFGTKSRKITFMIMPESNSDVIRIQMPGYVPWIGLFALLILIAYASASYMIHARTAQTERNLKLQIARISLAYKTDSEDKKRTISDLQNKLADLNDEASVLQSKVSQIAQLENDLKKITKYKGGPDINIKQNNPVKISSVSAVNGEGGGNEGQAAAFDAGTASDEDGSAAESAVVQRMKFKDPGYVSVQVNASMQQADKTKQSMNKLFVHMDQLSSTLSDEKQFALNKQHFLQVTPSMWPTIARIITSPFGYRRDPFTGASSFHDGIDIGARWGDPVYVTADGVVIFTGYDRFRGNHIIVKHANGLETEYMHLSKILIKNGSKVKKGETIGKVGSTGRSTGPHLHYSVIKNGQMVNPMPYTKPPKGDH